MLADAAAIKVISDQIQCMSFLTDKPLLGSYIFAVLVA